MAQWGRNDKSVTVTTSTTKETSNGAPIGTYALVKKGGGDSAHVGNTSGTRANTDKTMFGNTTVGAFIPGAAVGVFGVDPSETVVASGGPIASAYVTNPGSGYNANAAVTITVTNGGTSGVVNAFANSTGRINQVKIQTAGSGYITNPTISIAAPNIIIFNGNSSVTPNASIGAFVTLGANAALFKSGDYITYAGNANSTPVGLTDNVKYYVSFANSTGIKLSSTLGGANLVFAKSPAAAADAGGATFQGETATGYVVSGGNKGTGIAHAGWVLRTEGTGGRAGRVQYETLVAMGSLGQNAAKYGTAATTTDASDDTFLPDS